jgi:hypothetical protein
MGVPDANNVLMSTDSSNASKNAWEKEEEEKHVGGGPNHAEADLSTPLSFHFTAYTPHRLFLG